MSFIEPASLPFSRSQGHKIDLVPASQFTFAELTAAYNQTRIDYIVPMPMSVDRLREYVANYDVNLDASAVALDDDQMLGLAMLGVRPGHTWTTRLGLLPASRGYGVGQQLMEYLIAQSQALHVSHTILEVIKNNVPAHHLFTKLGFEETRELLVLRRPPGPVTFSVPPYEAQFLESEDAMAFLERRRSQPSWLDESFSLRNAGRMVGVEVRLKSGGWGWLLFQHNLFQFGRLVLQPEEGDLEAVARALLHALYSRYPRHDTKFENLPAADPYWPVFQEFGFVVSFQRIEMRLDLQQG